MKDYDTWLRNMRESIADYSYYTDFDGVCERAKKCKTELYLLSSIIHSPDIENEFKKLIRDYPNVLKAIPILVAKRDKIFILEDKTEYRYDFNNPNYPIEQYCDFMRKIGLFHFLQYEINQNLYDYVLGVEVGIDTNSRKNRGGHLMENYIEQSLIDAGLEYHKEMTIAQLRKKYGIDLSVIGNKRFDYVVRTLNSIYVVECNFYTGGGSKLNETAGSYEEIYDKLCSKNGVKFIWITDGIGWTKTKVLKSKWQKMGGNIYCLNELDNDIRGIFK